MHGRRQRSRTREGRKYQIRYDDGTEEWVGSDRLRSGSGSDVKSSGKSAESKPEGDKSTSSDSGSKAAKKAGKLKVGDKVEVRLGLMWRPGSIKKARGNGYYIHYDGMSDRMGGWVAANQVRRPGEQGEEDDPGFPGLKSRDHSDPFRQQEPDDPDRPLTKAKIDGATDLQFTVKSNAKFVPDPSSASKLSPKTIPLEGVQARIGNHVRELVFGRTVGFVVLGELGPHGSTFVEKVDLVAGKSTGVWPLMPETKLAAVSADGLRAALQSDRFFQNTKGRLDIFSLGKTPPTYVSGFLPYEELNPKSKDVKWARFVDESHLLTFGGGFQDSELVLWNLKDARAAWRSKLRDATMPTLSPGGKQAAFTIGGKLVVIDILSGETLASVSNPYGEGPIDFSPEGNKLALANQGVVAIFDLVKGELIAGIARSGRASTPAWTDSGHVLVGDSLVSVSKKCPVWSYKRRRGHLPLEVVGSVTWLVDADRGLAPPRLVGLSLPDDAALRAERSVDEGSHFVLRPGSKVSLDVQAGADSAKVVEAFTRQLEAVGIRVESGQPVIVRATSAKGKTQQTNYQVRQFGRPFERQVQTKSVTGNVYTVAIVDGDKKTAWQVSSETGAPVFVRAQKGESVDDALRRETQQNAGWFLSVKFPTHVPKADGKKGLGESTLTAQGIAEAQGVQ